MTRAYYNEIEPFAAQWLRNLIANGYIAPGEVDDRSIVEVQPDDLRGFTQCHFFAGLGAWSHALHLAGWPDDRPVWTGSCPCQPFSVAGQQKGGDDARHLWPVWHRLIRECRPPVVLGEQVAGAAGLAWLDLVHADMEAGSYAMAAADICAAGIGAPHIRQRLWWVADASPGGQREHGRASRPGGYAALSDDAGRLADAAGEGPQGGAEPGQRVDAQRLAAERDGGAGGLADTASIGAASDEPGRNSVYGLVLAGPGARSHSGDDGRNVAEHPAAGPLHGFWRNSDWLLCRDGKWRPVEPGTFPLASGASARVGRLRAYGNAICAPLAAEFIAAVMECQP